MSRAIAGIYQWATNGFDLKGRPLGSLTLFQHGFSGANCYLSLLAREEGTEGLALDSWPG